ncbi:photosystem II assembly protein [Microcoleus sp. FACHB-831]|uniref:photosystem II assembly protein n=1 Tax=Microcoleus sp. FACHB-831 TaxID=2692827 RepID=UPI001686FD6B|nr:photosystem II assembly protein [Microcoleus sp. FACHB-831]MBD1920820.1 photosystem II assembly protein [Microcoleus sp. FACHB-831]
MTNVIANWWRSRQFHTAIKQNNTRLAERLLEDIQKSGAKLSVLEKLFKDKLRFEQSSRDYKQQVAGLYREIGQTDLEKTSPQFVDFISSNFKLIEHDANLIQCTGIDQSIFEDLELNLVEYLNSEFDKIIPQRLTLELKAAQEDIEGLKSGQDPEYGYNLTPHVYFMKYFLENVYGAYLAWFLIYKYGLLKAKINILDIAAGPATSAYGLALLLQSSKDASLQNKMHISYYSLEQQASFQYRGLQFWRRYIEPQQTGINAYFRFETGDILNYSARINKLPEYFFDFIVISHGFFFDTDKRANSYRIYREIFEKGLKSTGYVLLIVQGRKLLNGYNVRQNDVGDREGEVIRKFVADLGLNLEWYKYMTSTGKRIPMGSGFAKFASENLPHKKYMGKLMRQYLGIKYDSTYVLDDYIILAKK